MMLAQMCGTVFVDELIESMPEELLQRWIAFHRWQPLNHTPRTLAMLTAWAGSFFGQNLEKSLTREQVTPLDLLFPWREPDDPLRQSQRALQQQQG